MRLKTCLATGLATLALGAQAQAQTPPAGSAADHAGHHPASASAASAQAPQSEGEVRRIDPAQGKLTLRHGPLANLDMPAMTMVFNLASPKLLEGLKEGDKVRFTAEKIGGRYVVTALQRQ